MPKKLGKLFALKLIFIVSISTFYRILVFFKKYFISFETIKTQLRSTFNYLNMPKYEKV